MQSATDSQGLPLISSHRLSSLTCTPELQVIMKGSSSVMIIAAATLGATSGLSIVPRVPRTLQSSVATGACTSQAQACIALPTCLQCLGKFQTPSAGLKGATCDGEYDGSSNETHLHVARPSVLIALASVVFLLLVSHSCAAIHPSRIPS